MKEETKKFSILRVTEEDRSQVEDVIVREFPLTIVLNNQEVVTLLCSPTKLEYLAIGYLWSEDLIKSKDELKETKLDREAGVVRGKTKQAEMPPYQGTGSDSLPGDTAEPQTKISAPQVFSLMENFIQRSQVFKATGGVHGAALCDRDNLLIFSEDIGRHNAIDKIFGECLLKDIPTDNRLIITSGRVSSEILLKVAKRNIPLLISRAAPTDLGLRLAADLGVTLIGFVRGKRMNVYTNSQRVAADEG